MGPGALPGSLGLEGGPVISCPSSQGAAVVSRYCRHSYPCPCSENLWSCPLPLFIRYNLSVFINLSVLSLCCGNKSFF